MLRLIPGCGYESDSFNSGFDLLFSSYGSDRRLLRYIIGERLITHHDNLLRGYVSIYYIPLHILENPGLGRLLDRACYDHIEKVNAGIGLSVHARWAASYDSYKLIECNCCLRFCARYDDYDNNLSLILYTTSYEGSFNKDVFFCLDFVETPRVQALRRLDG